MAVVSARCNGRLLRSSAPAMLVLARGNIASDSPVDQVVNSSPIQENNPTPHHGASTYVYTPIGISPANQDHRYP
jgi:hypothetical protein